jgi:hypothetical protein
MSSPVNSQLSGTFSTGATLAPVYISLPSGYDYIEIVNISDIMTPAGTIVKAEGFASLIGASFDWTSNGASPATLTPRSRATGGFTFIADSGDQTPRPAVALTSITTANPAVISSASAAIVGDIVRVYNTLGAGVGMLQVDGIDFTVTAVNPGVTQTLGFLNAAGFADAATSGTIRVIPFDARFYPRRRYVTAISRAAQAVIQLSVLHDFHVGEKVRIMVPAIPGSPATQTMVEMNNLLGTIVAVTNTIGVGTNSITVDINSTAFTAFRFPTSLEAAAGWTPAEVVPVGEAATVPYANLLDDATRNVSFTGVKIDTTILVASKNYSYIARKGTAI